MKSILNIPPIRASLAAMMVMASMPAAIAQTNLLVTGGTHVRDGDNAYAYLVVDLESDDGEVAPALGTALESLAFSIYRKDGLPADAGLYQLAGIMRPAVDQATVSAVLARSWQLRPEMTAEAQEAALGEALDRLFGALVESAADQSVPAKLADAVMASMDDPQYRSDLLLLGKTYPGVNMALGVAWAGPVRIDGPTTFELRIRDGQGEDMGVTGRLTVNASQPAVPLPSPGVPESSGIEIGDAELPLTAFGEFRDQSPEHNTQAENAFEELKEQGAGRKLHRAARLRWSTPTALRQRSILHNGFNIWRIPAEDADPAWLVAGPPLVELVTAGAVQINTLPVMIPEDLDPDQAADENDTETNFWTDELPDDYPLPTGAGQFVYFVTAMDILGRDGTVSPGRPIWILERMPPSVVSGVEVLNDYTWADGAGKQRFSIRWERVAEDDEAGSVEYEVFRWNRYDGPQRSLGALPFFVGTDSEILDDGFPGSPDESNARETFWYTVRAVRVLNAGDDSFRFPAAHSPPVFGVIRDRGGPEIEGGSLDRHCLEPVAISKPAVPGATQQPSNLDDRIIPVNLECSRPFGSRILEWAEFRYESGGAQQVTRIYFGDNDLAQFTLRVTEAEVFADSPELRSLACRVGAINGAVSDWADADLPPNLSKNLMDLQVPFEGFVNRSVVTSDNPCGSGGSNFPIDPDTDDRDHASGGVTVGPGTREVKIFRRVDDGPLTFVDRHEVADSLDPTDVEWTDTNPPPIHGGRMCYYAQGFSVDGMAGPIKLLACDFFPPSLPTPILDPLRPFSSDPSEPLFLLVKWACAPYGVDRFEVFISRNGQVPPPDFKAPVLTTNLALGGVKLPGQGDKMFGVYHSARVAARFMPAGTTQPRSEFPIRIPADPGAVYTVVVRAIGEPQGGDHEQANLVRGLFSDPQSGAWSPADPESINVPWPSRPIPPSFEPEKMYVESSLAERFLGIPSGGALQPQLVNHATFSGVGVRIGSLKVPETPFQQQKGAVYFGSKRIDPNLGVYRVAPGIEDANRLFPCVLYRHRVDDADDPALGTDLTQVTPMMESIAFGFVDALRDPDPAGSGTAIYDPFIHARDVGPAAGGRLVELLLTDTLPVIRGKTYRYLLVRFDPVTKEPRDVIPVSNPITIPTTP